MGLFKIAPENIITNHCDYCDNKGTDTCKSCLACSDYYSIPSNFDPITKLENENDTKKLIFNYFNLLDNITYVLNNLGFKIKE